MVDSGCAWAAASLCGDVVTSDYKLNLLAPAIGERLVCRSEDLHDRRAKALSLTERGRELVQAVEAQLVRLRHEVLADMAPADLEAALRVLHAFEAANHPPLVVAS